MPIHVAYQQHWSPESTTVEAKECGYDSYQNSYFGELVHTRNLAEHKEHQGIAGTRQNLVDRGERSRAAPASGGAP